MLLRRRLPQLSVGSSPKIRGLAALLVRVAKYLGVSSVLDLGQSPTSVVAEQERGELLLEALQQLPLAQQTLLELHYWEHLDSVDSSKDSLTHHLHQPASGTLTSVARFSQNRCVSSVRFVAPKSSNILERWLRTVNLLSPQSRATSALVSPLLTSSRICC